MADGVWEASDGAHGSVLFFGPYRSVLITREAARSIQRGDSEALAGSYVVWAKTDSRLAAEVQKVASCLKSSGSRGSSLAF